MKIVQTHPGHKVSRRLPRIGARERSLVTFAMQQQHNAKIVIPNEAKTKEIISNLISGGKSKLQIISDFDATITGIDSFQSWNVVETHHGFSQEYRTLTKEQYDHYHPIEISPVLPHSEKVKAMEEWWQKAHSQLLEVGMTRACAKRMVTDSNEKIVFRQHTKELFGLLDTNSIPCLVFSAGLGDVVQECLLIKDCNPPNIHIISNFMVFEGPEDHHKAIGWNDPLIHVFSKHMVDLEGLPYADQIKNRKNIILIGDSLGDANMADGMNYQNILKIGFLNLKVEERLEQFKEAFDVVLITDNTMDYLLDLVQQIIKNE